MRTAAGSTVGARSRVLPALRVTAEFVAALAVIVAAITAGPLLFAVAAGGMSTLHDLLLEVAVPAAVGIGVVLAVAAFARLRLARAILLGLWTGLAGTVALEVVRNVGYRAFDAMPGDLPRLLGMFATGDLMSGPDLFSDVVGYVNHVWNGASLGVVYVVLMGGFARRRGVVVSAVAGGLYGLLVGTAFLNGAVSMMTGAGRFGVIGPGYAVTVYLAHLAFGTVLGVLARRYGPTVDPLWTWARRSVSALQARTP